MLDFTDRVALVTGAARGLGFVYARELARRGARVILNDRGTDRSGQGSEPGLAERAAQTLIDEGLLAEASNHDIESADGCKTLVDELVGRHGRLDSVIHNAGWVAYQDIADLEPAFLERAIAIHLNASVWLAKAAWPVMARQQFGRILLTTSDRAIYPQYAQSGLAAYAATKMAVVGLVNALALEGAPHGIGINAISPVAKTRMWGIDGPPEDLTPESVAPGALFLVSDQCNASGWVLRASNGQFHATQAREADGVDYPRDLRGVNAAADDEVAAAWPRIAWATDEARHG